MYKQAERVEIEVEEVKDSAPSTDGSGVVLETEAKIDGKLHDASIEVQREDVTGMAVALLNSEAAPDGADGLPKAVKCLGAGVVHLVDDTSVRVHLQFDSGQVLPVEMSKDAAVALCRGLLAHTGMVVDGQRPDGAGTIGPRV